MLDHSPAIMGISDSHQFLQAVEVADVSGSQIAACHQVIEDTTDVDHHIAGWQILVSIIRQLSHQVVHHLCG